MAQGLVNGDPQRVGGYWLAGRLGAGGQGVVYEAYDAEGSRVAIKVLHGHSADDADSRERMRRETAAAQRVASFCTARVLAADIAGERPYIVSEYVEGPDLRRALARGRRFAGGDLHRLATAIATALAAIHEAGVVHRDLKPDNVLLGPDGPRVIDFGIARTLDMSLTATGQTAGTPTYMAPEVFGGTRAGMPADVFAWGAIVLFAATGADPFMADNIGAVMHRVLSIHPDLDVLPPSLRGLVGAALAKDPTARPTAPELLLALVSGDGRLDMARLLVEGTRTAGGMSRRPAGDPSLGTIAEETYETLSPADRELVPEIFLRLVTVGDDGELLARRVPREEIIGGRPAPEAEAVERVLGAFSYLVRAGAEEVAFTRPALPHAWPRMRGWVRADRDGLPAHREIATAARRWHLQGRKEGELMQGGSLERALGWAATGRRHITLTPVERDFLDAGAALTRRRARRGRVVTAVMAVLLVIALAATTVAVWQIRVAAAQRDEAEARRIAVVSEGLRGTDPVQAMLLSVAAWKLSPVPEARAALTGSLAQREVRVFQDPAADAVRRLSDDGRVLVSISRGVARASDVRTGAPAGAVVKIGEADGRIMDAAVSPRGRVLAVAIEGRDVRLWDLRTGHALPHTYPLGAASTHLGVTLTYGRSEHLLAVSLGEGETVWNTATGRTSAGGMCCGAIATPDGTAVISAGPQSTPVVRTTVPGGRGTTLMASCPQCWYRPALSEDGRTLAIGNNGAIGLHDPVTGAQHDLIMEGWNGGDLRFSHDGTLLASVAPAGVQVYRVADRALVMEHVVATDGARLAFDPDGRTLRYLDGDTVVSLDLTGLSGATTGHWAAMSSDARMLAYRDSATGEFGLARADTGGPAGRRLFSTRPGGLYTLGTAFSRDGRLLAVGGDDPDDSGITVWDTATRARRARLTGLASYPDAMAFAPDGRHLAALVRTGEPRTGDQIMLWDLRDGRRLWRLDRQSAAEIGFTPDGRAVVLRAEDARAVDVATGRPAGPVTLGDDARQTRLTGGGALYALGDAEGRLTLWTPGSGGPAKLILQGPTRDVTAVAASPDGRLIATVQGGRTGSVALWDRATGVLLGRPVVERINAVREVAFSADGRRLMVLDDQGGFAVQPIAPDALAAAACARAGRDLTPGEWAAQLPGLPYRPTCPSAASPR
ncbi:WD40 repeat domain-containing serine/threonine-protein kinase [Sphaerisporangium sp. NPDC005288]|uniref:WD40 repeat domain-containing serine/threonine-protein kinase n=1 Tax=Sphaerisporangium sp. NPDC005288 TaxID=3155114 RepID=UPI0033BD7AA1